mmetsp:Transcript_26656/g.47975  ORF Transcript_26656/g.47975 Transcript_26656/m.47975 type:complete len:83 (+) Transcript_26656:338-586(+)
MFVTGPEGAGKSWFIQRNLHKLAEMKAVRATQEVKPFLFHFDLKKWPALNFDSFLDIYETEIIKELAKRSGEKFKGVQLFTE